MPIKSATFITGLLTCLLLLVLSPAHARETNGIDFPDQLSLGNRTLVLNGTATREVFGIHVYAAGLYVSKSTGDAGEIMNRNDDPKRLRIVMLRDVGEDKFASAARDNIARNFSDAEKTRFSGDFDTFFKCFANGKDLVKGSEVIIDFLPNEGTVVRVGAHKLAVIPGKDFYHALLRLWIGKPLQTSMKTGLLVGK